MERKPQLVSAALMLGLMLCVSASYAQAKFKIPYKFQAGGKTYPAGEYWLTRSGEAEIKLRQQATGQEVLIAFTDRLPQPAPPLDAPQLVFDAVGNFEPSYTEYFTVYILAEVWLPGEDGFRVHTTKGAHQNQVVKGQAAEERPEP